MPKQRAKPEPAVLDYETRRKAFVPQPAIVLLLCAPMAFTCLLSIAQWIMPIMPTALREWFWAIRAVAMAMALVSIFIYDRSDIAPRLWYVTLNRWVNLLGLAICIFFIFRWVAAIVAYNER